jgi:hypothetical protein
VNVAEAMEFIRFMSETDPVVAEHEATTRRMFDELEHMPRERASLIAHRTDQLVRLIAARAPMRGQA